MTVQALYPEHVCISLTHSEVRTNFNSGEINLICQSHVKKYLEDNLGLNVELVFPSNFNIQFFSRHSIIGFVYAVEGVRIAFIPSEDLNFEEFEIQQEWVDLSTWFADYYVPIQVDLEGEFLHLWGFVSHKNVKEQGEYDPIFRTYSVNGQYLSDNLDNLWLICDLQASGDMLPERATIPKYQLLPNIAQGVINNFRQHLSSGFLPRLDLVFEEWAGILNDRQWLDMYLSPAIVSAPVKVAASVENRLTNLSDWFDDRAAEIYQEWKSISEFFKTPQMQSGSRSIDRVKELTICPQVNLMYRSTGKNTEELVSLIHNTSSQNDRWEAIEYLWKLDPDHPALPIYKLMDLGLFFRGEQLSLLVSIISNKSDKLGILIRLSPNDRENTTTLPSGIKLSLLGKEGDISREIIAQDSKYQCLQLIFDADFDDLFSICVTLNNNQLTKQFQV